MKVEYEYDSNKETWSYRVTEGNFTSLSIARIIAGQLFRGHFSRRFDKLDDKANVRTIVASIHLDREEEDNG